MPELRCDQQNTVFLLSETACALNHGHSDDQISSFNKINGNVVRCFGTTI